ncbi:MAG: MarR family transcriptional regulator [Methanomicrobiales archaeon]|nr:MarR family transcriptional regulator [Methanomicrobiales archaeon]
MTDILVNEASKIYTDILEVVSERLSHLIRPYITGKQGAQYRLLHYLNKTPMETMTNLGKVMYVPKQHMTKLVDSLITEGYVERHNDPNDRRVICVQITKEGQKKLVNLRLQIKEKLSWHFKNYEPADLELLIATAQNIIYLWKKYP